MQLPPLTIPYDLPFEVPMLMHPLVVHFAIALPIVVLLLEFANAFAKKRAISVTSLLLLLLAIVVYVAAYYTGKHDGGEAYAMLGADAQAELKEHKLLGTYLMVGLVVPLAVKLLMMLVRATWVRILFFLVMIVFIAGMVKQGKDGGELVYEYGVNVTAVQDANDELEDAKDELQECESALDEAKKSVEEAKAALSSGSEAHDEVVSVDMSEPVTEEKAAQQQSPAAVVSESVEATANEAEEAAHETADAAQQAAQQTAEEATRTANEAAAQAQETAAAMTRQAEAAASSASQEAPAAMEATRNEAVEAAQTAAEHAAGQ